MEMTGTQRIEAPRERVWQALNDPTILRAAIPGCESVEKVSDTAMTAVVVLRLGPVKAAFQGDVTLSDLDPPNGYTISGEGKGGSAGFAKGSARVTLAPQGAATDLSYSVKADVGGKLAQLGGRLIDSTARRLAEEFFERFASALAVPGAEPVMAGVGPVGAVEERRSPVLWFALVAAAAIAVGVAWWYAH